MSGGKDMLRSEWFTHRHRGTRALSTSWRTHRSPPSTYPGSVGRRSTQSTLESYTPPSPHRGPHALDCPSADRAELVHGLPVALECVWYSSGSQQMPWHSAVAQCLTRCGDDEVVSTFNSEISWARFSASGQLIVCTVVSTARSAQRCNKHQAPLQAPPHLECHRLPRRLERCSAHVPAQVG